MNTVSFVRSQACRSAHLWRGFCLRTGKGLPPAPPSVSTSLTSNILTYPQCDARRQASINPGKENKSINCRFHYYQNPCVPVDFYSITEAITHCVQGGTVTIMPGIYTEQIKVETKADVTIRAAFPEVGAALVHYCRTSDDTEIERKNSPCINIFSTFTSGFFDPIIGSAMTIRLSYLRILHSVPGSDIWSGNCAVRVDGIGAHLILDSCALQSDSGR